MSQNSVVAWLKDLRTVYENYDDYGADSTTDLDITDDTEDYCYEEDEDEEEIIEEEEDDESLYDKVWECVSGDYSKEEEKPQQQQQQQQQRQEKNKDQLNELSYGQICRVSVLFDDNFEKLNVLPVIFENIDLDISEDVMLWKRELRYTYCSEDQNMLESEELMTSFEGQNTNGNQITREPKFPTDELEGVEVRQRTTPQRPTRSKTLNFDSPRTQRKPEPGFELKGPMKIKTPEMCVKIRSNQKLRYFDNQLQILSESKSKMEILVLDLKFQRNTISMINKKEVEMKDTYYKNYIFHFDNSKDAKHFYEQEKNLFNERTPIKTMLKRLLGMRSSRDLLESKGILKNEQIFGNTLQNVYGVTNDIPEFIKRIIELIERPENIKSTGLYRTSGNLATIQKIRLEVDNGKLEILEEFKDDVDVLTGSLKLFFRELKELVIPEEIYYRLIKVTENESTETTTDIINSLPASNREVLLYLLAHLVKVYEHKESNRMDIYNLAVCWGPSLIGISNSGADLVSQATQVSKVMEHLITYQKTLSEARKSPRKSFRKQISKESLSGKIPEVKVYDFVYEVVKKLTELIERNINVEGIYKKSGSEEKKRVILRKIDQRQINDLDHLKLEVHDICSALKKYLLQLPEPLIPTSLQNEDCDNPNEEQLRSHLDQIPKKDALILLLRHISKVQKHNNMSKSYIIDYWTATLIKDAEKQKIKKCSKLLEILITLMEPKPLPDLIQEQNRIRESTYDNVDREATFLDEKTEEAVGTRL